MADVQRSRLVEGRRNLLFGEARHSNSALNERVDVGTNQRASTIERHALTCSDRQEVTYHCLQEHRNEPRWINCCNIAISLIEKGEYKPPTVRFTL